MSATGAGVYKGFTRVKTRGLQGSKQGVYKGQNKGFTRVKTRGLQGSKQGVHNGQNKGFTRGLHWSKPMSATDAEVRTLGYVALMLH
eukprot:1145517-Pelagomonas_calceolata.AAC.4